MRAIRTLALLAVLASLYFLTGCSANSDAPIAQTDQADEIPTVVAGDHDTHDHSNANHKEYGAESYAGGEPAVNDDHGHQHDHVHESPNRKKSAGSKTHSVVKVFYATDRARKAPMPDAVWWYLSPALGSCAISLIAGIAAVLSVKHRKFYTYVTSAGMIATVACTAIVFLTPSPDKLAAPNLIMYGGDRGELELGECEVSVPHNHRPGGLESPSILRLEVRAKQNKHIILENVTPKDTGIFYDDLRNVVQKSPRKEIVVFVHGYNVSFNDAVRRTAQIAFDLEFKGAPILYSWPSQAQLLKYSVDSNNATWTAPHLKRFLLEVVERSDAEVVNLIAHSMGTRALSEALKEIALEKRDEAKQFKQIVLAAPDIDADIFLRDIAPRIVNTAERVTLYASSQDKALIASKQFHGHPRAGDSGRLLVTAPGIETIDVSGLSSGFLGHSYYGDNDSILQDLHHLISHPCPAEHRPWLDRMNRENGEYWVFNPTHPMVACATEDHLR